MLAWNKIELFIVPVKVGRCFFRQKTARGGGGGVKAYLDVDRLIADMHLSTRTPDLTLR